MFLIYQLKGSTHRLLVASKYDYELVGRDTPLHMCLLCGTDLELTTGHKWYPQTLYASSV